MVGRLIAQRDATRQLQRDAEQQQQRQTKLRTAERYETANHAHAHAHDHVYDRTSGQGPPTGLNRDRVSVAYSTSSCGLRSA